MTSAVALTSGWRLQAGESKDSRTGLEKVGNIDRGAGYAIYSADGDLLAWGCEQIPSVGKRGLTYPRRRAIELTLDDVEQLKISELVIKTLSRWLADKLTKADTDDDEVDGGFDELRGRIAALGYVVEQVPAAALIPARDLAIAAAAEWSILPVPPARIAEVVASTSEPTMVKPQTKRSKVQSMRALAEHLRLSDDPTVAVPTLVGVASDDLERIWGCDHTEQWLIQAVTNCGNAWWDLQEVAA